MRYFLFLTIFCFSILSAVTTKAQETQAVTLNLQKASFKQFVTVVEKQTNFYFYFNTVDTDSLQVTIAVNNESISNVLQQIFKETDLQFSITANQKIFITRTVQLQNNLGTLYFNPPVAAEKSKKTIAIYEDTTADKNNNIFVQNITVVIKTTKFLIPREETKSQLIVKLIEENKLDVKREEMEQAARMQVMSYFGQYGMPSMDDSWMDSLIQKQLADKKFADELYNRIITDKLFFTIQNQLNLQETDISTEEFLALINKPHHHHHH